MLSQGATPLCWSGYAASSAAGLSQTPSSWPCTSMYIERYRLYRYISIDFKRAPQQVDDDQAAETK